MKPLTLLIRGFWNVRDPDVPDLLGQGVDSIIQRVTRTPTDAQRLLRYARAKYVFYSAASAKQHSQMAMLELRTRLGEQYRSAWRAGRFPRFNLQRRPQVVQLHTRRTEARAS